MMNTLDTAFSHTHNDASPRIIRRVSANDIEVTPSSFNGLQPNQQFENLEGIQSPGLNGKDRYCHSTRFNFKISFHTNRHHFSYFLSDVLSGRGSAANNHIGNIRFREMVKKYQNRYRSASKADKPIVALEIVLRWKALSPPGRFLSKSTGKGGDLWHEISEEKATRKVAQRLRETDSSFAASQQRRRSRQERTPSQDAPITMIPADSTTEKAIAKCSSNIMHLIQDDSSVTPIATPLFTTSMDEQLDYLYSIVQEDNLQDFTEDSSKNGQNIPLACDLLDVF